MSPQTQLTPPFPFFPPAEVQAIKTLEREKGLLERDNERMKEETRALKVTIRDLQKDLERVRGNTLPLIKKTNEIFTNQPLEKK